MLLGKCFKINSHFIANTMKIIYCFFIKYLYANLSDGIISSLSSLSISISLSSVIVFNDSTFNYKKCSGIAIMNL